MNAKYIFNKELIERYFTILFYWGKMYTAVREKKRIKRSALVSVTLFYV